MYYVMARSIHVSRRLRLFTHIHSVSETPQGVI